MVEGLSWRVLDLRKAARLQTRQRLVVLDDGGGDGLLTVVTLARLVAVTDVDLRVEVAAHTQRVVVR